MTPPSDSIEAQEATLRDLFGLDYGLIADEPARQALIALADRAREAERERDSLMADSWRAYVESGADPDGDVRWHCRSAQAGVSLVGAVQSLRKDYEESLGETETAERERDKWIEDSLIALLEQRDRFQTRAERAEAEAKALREAIREHLSQPGTVYANRKHASLSAALATSESSDGGT